MHYIIGVIIGIVALLAFFGFVLILGHLRSYSEFDRKVDDEEQEAFIREYMRKNSKKREE